MLTNVQVFTDQGALLTLSLEDVSEGFVIQSIDGLDPVNATVVSSNFALMASVPRSGSTITMSSYCLILP